MALSKKRTELPIERLDVSAYKIPTDYPESDGTLKWDSTTMVVVEVEGGGKRGLGFSYASAAAAKFIDDKLSAIVKGQDAMDVAGIWEMMGRQVRNQGFPGTVSMAISAVDVALWDLKARLLDLPLVSLLGAVRKGVPVYGSGGFTSYPIEKLQEQLGGWSAEGFEHVKMKVGTHPAEDIARVRAAREVIGPTTKLFVDGNGAYSRKQALAFAEAFAEYDVVWFEEPVSSDDLAGLRLLRNRAPAGMDITAGEYGYDLWYFRRMLEAEAVDVLMADGTRCGGITGFMNVGTLCKAFIIPFSGHTAPSIHLHPCCALAPVLHLEYFHDHVRIEHLLFDGALTPVEGVLYPDLSRPGLGLDFKRQDAARYLTYGKE